MGFKVVRVKVWIGFKWLSVGYREHGHEPSGGIKDEFLNQLSSLRRTLLRGVEVQREIPSHW
jgi:hypothetical protein